MNNNLGTIAIILAIVALLLSGVAVAFNREAGPEGEKGAVGLTGSQGPKGDTGAQGPPGQNGNSASVNLLPTIKLVYMDGNYIGIMPRIYNYCKYTYGITVQVDDPEDETIRVAFYYSDGSAGPWNAVSVFYGKDGKYSASQDFQYTAPQGIKKIFWLVEAWDGSDIATEVFPQTISP